MSDFESTAALFDRMQRIRETIGTPEEIERQREQTERVFEHSRRVWKLAALWFAVFAPGKMPQ
jgi:HD superfamily phosphodiesterase